MRSHQQSSWKTGFAGLHRLKPAHPNLWDGLEHSYLPELGSTAGIVYDVANQKKVHGALFLIDPVTGWVEYEEGHTLDYTSGTSGAINLNGVVINTANPFSIAWRSNLRSYTDAFPGEFRFATDQATGFTVIHNTNNASYRPLTFGSNLNFLRLKPTVDWSAAALGVWQSYVITYNGKGRATPGNYGFYRNGVSEALNAGGAFAGIASVSQIGYSFSTTSDWDGQIGAFFLYSRILNVNEAMLIHQRPKALLESASRSITGVLAEPEGAVTPYYYEHLLAGAS